MWAHVEQPDHGYQLVDMEPPEECFFCDRCGDCLKCEHDEGLCWDGRIQMWVVYLNDPLNPNRTAEGTQIDRAKGER